MNRLRLLIAAAFLTLAAQPILADEYSDASMRFTIPDGYSLETFQDTNTTGFVATKADETITFFNIRLEDQIGRKQFLKQPDAQWFPSLEGRKIMFSHTPVWRSYDKVTQYKNKHDDGYVRVYRYASARNIGFLVVQNHSGQWDEADKIATSHHFNKTFRFIRENLTFYMINGIYWILIFAAVISIIVNSAFKLHKIKFALIETATLALCLAGLYFIDWPPSRAGLLVALGILAIITGAVCNDPSPSSPNNNSDTDTDFDAPTYDGTGTKIDLDI